MPTKLHIYDFDKTTFKSPEKPDWWTKGWWGRDESLGPPCVPEKPGPDWWNGAVVSKAKRSISDQDVHAVLVTGRVGKFKQRIHTLLRQAGLNFNEVLLSTGKNTEAFKLAAFKDLLAKLPDVTEVEIWDDRSPHLGTFKKFFESVGLKCKPHLIKIEPHEVDCPPDTKMAHRVVSRWLDIVPIPDGYGVCPSCGVKNASGSSRTRGGRLSRTRCGACNYEVLSTEWGAAQPTLL